ncbi:hypothetical protein FOZ60_000584 [Perkinsus olseni]|uniref:AMP-dependent synthetase/ligase domain-containing protein n=1 Tax=Perkinsus olseni TaxID=32597 RepID=A0A7J6P207_PEROL|nr:hypothetical protein FOZ60_000584 [Perkinsus olseni]
MPFPMAESRDYAFEIPHSAVPGVSGSVYRHPGYKNRLQRFIDDDSSIVTSFDVFKRTVEKYPDRPCHGTRPILDDGSVGPFEWQTYKEVYERIINFGRGLEELNLLSKSEDGSMRLIGIYMKNRSEWVIAEQGAFTRRTTTVPLYDTLGEDTVHYILNQTELSTVVCSALQVPNLVKVKGRCRSLRTIICVDHLEKKAIGACLAVDVKLLSMDEVERLGADLSYSPLVGAATDIATFCYTSGTTGEPKGALLSQGSVIADAAAFVECFTSPYPLSDLRKGHHYYLNYLPLPHVFGRVVEVALYYLGVAVGFYQGDPLKLMDDIAALRPTVFVSVPRLLNRLYERVITTNASAGFDKAVQAKLNLLKCGTLKHSQYDRGVFDKIKERLGLDRVQLVFTGSAPIATHVLDFLRLFFARPVLEGYGSTESGLASYTHPSDFASGHVGYPASCMEIKLADVPEMGYLSTDTEHGSGVSKLECRGRGEILLRGPSIFSGYYKMPEKTKETIDSDGWVHSGDIGLWLKTGQLKIIDRKKSIFKLSNGEYVAPERIENVLIQSPYVAQAFVYGNSLRSSLVAIIVPDFENLSNELRNRNDLKSPEDICRSKYMNSLILRTLREVSEKSGLRKFEWVKAIHLSPVMFSVDNDILTPSFKLKRNVAVKVFQKEVDALYEQIGETILDEPRSKM